jgi:hypothetical protein
MQADFILVNGRSITGTHPLKLSDVVEVGISAVTDFFPGREID